MLNIITNTVYLIQEFEKLKTIIRYVYNKNRSHDRIKKKMNNTYVYCSYFCLF